LPPQVRTEELKFGFWVTVIPAKDLKQKQNSWKGKEGFSGEGRSCAGKLTSLQCIKANT